MRPRVDLPEPDGPSMAMIRGWVIKTQREYHQAEWETHDGRTRRRLADDIVTFPSESPTLRALKPSGGCPHGCSNPSAGTPVRGLSLPGNCTATSATAAKATAGANKTGCRIRFTGC